MTLQIWLSWLGDEWGEFKAQKLKLSSVMLLMPNISTHLHWHQKSSRSNNFITNFLLSLPFFFDVPLDHADSHATAAITHASHLGSAHSHVRTHLAVLTSGALASDIFWCLLLLRAVFLAPRCVLWFSLIFFAFLNFDTFIFCHGLSLSCVWGAMYPACRHLEGMRMECFRFLTDG